MSRGPVLSTVKGLMPAGQCFMDYPDYSYPPCLFLAVASDILLLRHRSFHFDAKACIEKLNPPFQVLGKENIPRYGPCVVTVNHYHRPGFGAQWLALAAAAAIPVDMHWLMTTNLPIQANGIGYW